MTHFKLRFPKKETILVQLIFICAFCLRFFVLISSDNFDGLSIQKTIKAINILSDPNIFRNFDPSQSPLPNYLFAIALFFWNEPLTTTRIVSLIFGSFLIFPFYHYTRSVFDQRIALFSTLIAAFYPLHVIYSTLSTGDVLFHFFSFSSFHFFMKFKSDSSKNFCLIVSALLIGCATLCRFEGGLFIPLMLFFLRRLRKRHLVLFSLLSMSLPIGWMFVNYQATGNPLSFLHAVEKVTAAQLNLHREMSHLPFQFYDKALGWPKMLWTSLTPPVALLGFGGLIHSLWKKKYSFSTLSFLVLICAFIYKSTKEELLILDRYGITLALLLIPFPVLLLGQLTSSLRLHQRSIGVVLGILAASLVCAMLPTTMTQRAVYPTFTKDIGSYLAKHAGREDKILLDTTGDDNLMEAVIMNSGIYKEQRIFRCPRKIMDRRLSIDETAVLHILHQEKPRFFVYAPEGRFLAAFFRFSSTTNREERFGAFFEFVFESGPFRVYEVFYPK